MSRDLCCDLCDRPIVESEVGAESAGVVVCHDCCAERFDEGYAVGFSEGRATTYPPDERTARLNELCRAHDLILARSHDPHAAARVLAERIAMLRRQMGHEVEEPPPYYDPAHEDALRHSYHG